MDQAKEVLIKSIKDLVPTNGLQELLLNAPEDTFVNKTTKDILLYYDRLVRLLQNAIAYLAQENKNRESISISDKTQIRNLRAAYHSKAASSAKPPSVEVAVDKSGIIKTTIISVGAILFLLIFVWAVDNGII